MNKINLKIKKKNIIKIFLLCIFSSVRMADRPQGLKEVVESIQNWTGGGYVLPIKPLRQRLEELEYAKKEKHDLSKSVIELRDKITALQGEMIDLEQKNKELTSENKKLKAKGIDRIAEESCITIQSEIYRKRSVDLEEELKKMKDHLILLEVELEKHGVDTSKISTIHPDSERCRSNQVPGVTLQGSASPHTAAASHGNAGSSDGRRPPSANGYPSQNNGLIRGTPKGKAPGVAPKPKAKSGSQSASTTPDNGNDGSSDQGMPNTVKGGDQVELTKVQPLMVTQDTLKEFFMGIEKDEKALKDKHPLVVVGFNSARAMLIAYKTAAYPQSVLYRQLIEMEAILAEAVENPETLSQVMNLIGDGTNTGCPILWEIYKRKGGKFPKQKHGPQPQVTRNKSLEITDERPTKLLKKHGLQDKEINELISESKSNSTNSFEFYQSICNKIKARGSVNMDEFIKEITIILNTPETKVIKTQPNQEHEKFEKIDLNPELLQNCLREIKAAITNIENEAKKSYEAAQSIILKIRELQKGNKGGVFFQEINKLLSEYKALEEKMKVYFSIRDTMYKREIESKKGPLSEEEKKLKTDEIDKLYFDLIPRGIEEKKPEEISAKYRAVTGEWPYLYVLGELARGTNKFQVRGPIYSDGPKEYRPRELTVSDDFFQKILYLDLNIKPKSEYPHNKKIPFGTAKVPVGEKNGSGGLLYRAVAMNKFLTSIDDKAVNTYIKELIELNIPFELLRPKEGGSVPSLENILNVPGKLEIFDYNDGNHGQFQVVITHNSEDKEVHLLFPKMDGASEIQTEIINVGTNNHVLVSLRTKESDQIKREYFVVGVDYSLIPVASMKYDQDERAKGEAIFHIPFITKS